MKSKKGAEMGFIIFFILAIIALVIFAAFHFHLLDALKEGATSASGKLRIR